MTLTTLRELQEEQKAWVKHNFPDRQDHHPLLGALEELGELAHHHLKAALGIRGSAKHHLEKEKDAIGDVVLFLSDYCTARGFDFQLCVEYTWRKVKGRDWVANPSTGGEFDYYTLTEAELVELPRDVFDRAMWERRKKE